MNRVFKYPLEPDHTQMLMMPQGAKPLSVAEQDGMLVMWVQVDPDAKLEQRLFRVVTTGDWFDAEGNIFIGSAILGKDGPWFVAHVFEHTVGVWDFIDRHNEDDFVSIKQELKDQS